MENQNTPSPRTPKRSSYLEWTEYFMATAFLAAQRSKDPSTQVGACIVNTERKIVGIGYNGFPRGCSDLEFPWQKNASDPLQNKYLYVVHAEQNAIMNKNSATVNNCTMYVALFPCNECAKIIIQSGIREVVYMSDKHSHKLETIAAKRMFDATGVRYWQFVTDRHKIIVDFLVDIGVGISRLIIESPTSPRTAVTENRSNYLSWPDYFMAVAFLAAQRSKDPSTQVGACIVNNEHKVVGVGYNGFPQGCSDDEFPWNRDEYVDSPLETKYLFVCHAEANAIANKNCSDVKGCTIYVALFPCNECAKGIIQSGIRKVIYMSDKYGQTPAVLAAKKMFQAARVTYEQFEPSQTRIVIDFRDIERKNFNQLPASPTKAQ